MPTFLPAALSLLLAGPLVQAEDGRATPEATEPAPLFVERGGGALAELRMTSGGARDRKDYILEVNGGGIVVGDFDGDGLHDLVAVDGSTVARIREGRPGLPPRLFLNAGALEFASAETRADTHWAMTGARWGMGGAAGDVNGDGALDLFVTEWGPNRLFLNDAGRGFGELGEAAGLGQELEWSTSAAFLDADLDGDLDLAVTNYLVFDLDEIPGRGAPGCNWKGHLVMCGPEGLTAVHDRFFRGRGDGTFEDATVDVGFRPETPGYGLGILTVDADDDGDTDLYVSNDSTPNHLWINDGAGHFVERGYGMGVSHDSNGKEQAGMGLAAGDVDGDGKPELFVTNFSGENNSLYRAGKSGRFRERSDAFGIGGASRRWLGWGTGMADFDLDGDVDLFVLNGHVYPEADEPGTDTEYAQEDHLYRSQGGRFALEPLVAGAARVSRAGAAADLDGDGDVDIVALELDGAVRILECRAADQALGHWLRVRLESKSGDARRSVLGARVRVHAGERVFGGELRTAGGFQAAVAAELHFGLGAVTEVERVEVRWPSGRTQVVEVGAVDRLLRIEETQE